MSKPDLATQVATLEKEIDRYRRSKAIVTVLCNIAEAVNLAPSLQELYRNIHHALSPVIDTSNFYIALYEPKNDSLIFPYIVDTVDTKYPPAVNVSSTSSLTAWVIREKRPMLLRKADINTFRQQSFFTQPSCTTSEIWLGAPLKTLRGVIGVIAVQSYTDPLCYDEEHLHILTSVADMAAIAIERKRSDDALAESEEKFRKIVTTVREGIVMLDQQRHIGFTNDHFAEMLGYRSDEVLEKPFETFLFAEDRADFHRRQDEREANREERFERRFKTKTGESLWAIVAASPFIAKDGQSCGSFGVITDITERKLAEMALQEANDKLRRAMEQVKTLRGIVPICMHCKKIRDDKGYWNQVEVYVRDHTEAEFSHGLCPECVRKVYPDLFDT